MLAQGALVATPLVALPGGGTPTIALTATITNMAKSPSGTSASTTIAARIRVSTQGRLTPGFALAARAAAFSRANLNFSFLLGARLTVRSGGFAVTLVVRQIAENRLPLYTPSNNTYWPGQPTASAPNTVNPLQAEDGTALLTESSDVIEIE